MEQKELALECYWQSIHLNPDSNRGILKVALLLKHHLNIDPISLFESEGTNQSLVLAGQTFAHKHAASPTSQWLANPSLTSNVVALKHMQELAKYRLSLCSLINSVVFEECIVSVLKAILYTTVISIILLFCCVGYQGYYYPQNGLWPVEYCIAQVVINPTQ